MSFTAKDVEEYLRRGASRQILEDSLKATRPVPEDDLEREQKKGSYGGLLGGDRKSVV